MRLKDLIYFIIMSALMPILFSTNRGLEIINITIALIFLYITRRNTYKSYPLYLFKILYSLKYIMLPVSYIIFSKDNYSSYTLRAWLLLLGEQLAMSLVLIMLSKKILMNRKPRVQVNITFKNPERLWNLLTFFTVVFYFINLNELKNYYNLIFFPLTPVSITSHFIPLISELLFILTLSYHLYQYMEGKSRGVVFSILFIFSLVMVSGRNRASILVRNLPIIFILFEKLEESNKPTKIIFKLSVFLLLIAVILVSTKNKFSNSFIESGSFNDLINIEVLDNYFLGINSYNVSIRMMDNFSEVSYVVFLNDLFRGVPRIGKSFRGLSSNDLYNITYYFGNVNRDAILPSFTQLYYYFRIVSFIYYFIFSYLVRRLESKYHGSDVQVRYIIYVVFTKLILSLDKNVSIMFNYLFSIGILLILLSYLLNTVRRNYTI